MVIDLSDAQWRDHGWLRCRSFSVTRDSCDTSCDVLHHADIWRLHLAKKGYAEINVRLYCALVLEIPSYCLIVLVK